MNDSKIQLSEEEMQLVNNSHWILTKHGIIEKVYRLMGAASLQMQSVVETSHYPWPEEMRQASPKISKGEKYGGLPYVVLDYPRFFSKEHVFAIRSFFWWGKYFTVTLHVKGSFLQQFGDKIMQAVVKDQLPGFHISYAGDEFNFDLEQENYSLLHNGKETFFPVAGRTPFLKISKRISFEHWDTAQQEIVETFRHFIAVITS